MTLVQQSVFLSLAARNELSPGVPVVDLPPCQSDAGLDL